MDIKYYCVNNFKLIYLTDQEYWVKDRPQLNNPGIYQALMSVYPNNNILKSLIQDIVYNCKQNIYKSDSTVTPLDITGPGLVSKYFKPSIIDSFKLENIGDIITFNNIKIMLQYEMYRKEQQTHQVTKYYDTMFHNSNIYNYPSLTSTNNINYTRVIHKNILGTECELYSCTPTIVELDGSYLINIRWINYKYNHDGSKKEIPKTWISLNSRFTVDLDFNKISDETFLEEDFQNKNNIGIGTEPYKLNKNIILPTMYDLNIKRVEKNWSFVKYKNDLCVIYDWYPLQIGKIDYTTNMMNIIEIKSIPEYFKDARGSSCGYIKNNEIWFVLHKAQCSSYDQLNYQHFFAVFDLDMNLIRYSELFKFGDRNVEFCISLIVKDYSIILSYSLMDIQCFISEYNLDDINNIKWYNNTKWYKIESE